MSEVVDIAPHLLPCRASTPNAPNTPVPPVPRIPTVPSAPSAPPAPPIRYKGQYPQVYSLSASPCLNHNLLITVLNEIYNTPVI